MSDGLNREGFTEPQADEIPDVYARYIRATFPPEVLVNAPNEIAGRWRHTTGSTEREFWRSLDALDRLAPQPAPELAAAETPECEFRDELTELTERHDSLLHAILPASSDPCDGDEDGDDLAVRYVRDLEAERDRLRLLVGDSEPLSVKPSDDVPRELAAAMGESRRALDRLAAIRDLCQKRLRVVGMVDGKGVARKIIAIIDKPEA